MRLTSARVRALPGWVALSSIDFSSVSQAFDARPVRRDAEPGPGRQVQREIVVAQRLDENLLGQQQRAEQLGAPAERIEGAEQLSGGDRADRPFEHRAAIQVDMRGRRDRGDARRAEQAARLRDLDREHVGRARLRELEGIVRAVQRFVGHHRHGRLGGQAREACVVGGGDRLLDQAYARLREARRGP